MHPLRSLSDAIIADNADLIIACDDRVVEHLHQLHAQATTLENGDRIRAVIERSLGAPSGYSVTRSRWSLLQLARTLGISIPETGAAQTLDDLKVWLKEHGFPAVLKVDGTWGGTGVRLVHSWGEAEQAFLQLTRPLPAWEMLRFMSNHDFFPLFSRNKNKAPEVTIQRYVDGRSANTMFACWQGQVIDDLSVETLFAVDHLGSSTIVRTINHADMKQAGRALVEHLSMSGLCGLDFIVEASTGKVFLIELNPRATQIGHLEPGDRPSLVSMLCRAIAGESPAASEFREDTIAFFPHILRCGPDIAVPNVSNMHQDIPWEEPELIQELMRKPWNRRHISSVLYAIAQKLIDPPPAKISRSATEAVPEDLHPRQ